MFLGTILTCIAGYFIGSFSFSILVVKIKKGQDIRKLGSKNAGATNASRVIGLKWGILIMFLDSFKVVLTAVVALLFNLINSDLFNMTSFYIPLFFTLIGHCWPIYYKFKGGKAVSCFLGLILVTNFILFFVFIISGLLIFFTFKKVSLSSICASLLVCILMWVPYISGNNNFDINGLNFFNKAYSNGLYFVWFNKFHDLNKNYNFYDSFLTINIVTTISTLFLVYKHKANIKRLLSGTEPKFKKK
ncbi:glycerol-3-phosphate 1-O-acyltransferase PlsY [Spiroplasma turonicum]|uniref:Glycerol-3-phosphate acyltransferase n=1 Tax=Spiroplasma turonicum TaxID=216946 RepID=A0A0K1P5Z7_9MOLU|nr:glycerol-3-phosphate 1-O-acyltransferase PlsY [Spiroplasma turonicum]AKU79738.1 glycerol-3-phosphate acyltransferase PlsY [Spiroplasma turonicum]ALX70756.1 glycerol-3-phosphate acyltransferase PlsY [Spiroplasma turonicum]